MPYERLLKEADQHGIYTYEKPLRNKGLYCDNVIWINKSLSNIDKACILAEELGHYHTSTGNILDLTITDNRKQERRAREWAYERLVPLSGIVEAYYAGVSNGHDLAEFLDVTEEFLTDAIDRYRDKHGQFFAIDRYVIYFDPLAVATLY